ncbi:inositol polyphosphate kinase [Seiridium cupressi]
MNGDSTPRLLAAAATFPQTKRALSGDREMPKRSELVDYNYAVAGHAGTLCDADGELFIKPCTKSEIEFYESAHALHPDFADLMPLYYGSLSLTENTTEQMIHAAIPAIVENADIPAAIKEEVQSHLHLDERPVLAPIPELQRAATDGVTWIPNKSRKITTDRAIVLHNSSFGFKKPNIMDAKLGLRLWADDAPLEKQQRFNEIANTTTHKKYGFRVAGMRVYRGSTDPTELDEEGFKVYDKYWGRDTVTEENVLEMLKDHFLLNKAAGIDQELGKLIAQAFLADLRRVQEVLEANESRMYSASLLFVFEGDGKALRTAMEDKTALEREREARRKERVSVHDTVSFSGPCANLRVDSGIGMDDDGNAILGTTVIDVGDEFDGSDISDDSEEFSSEPYIYSLKLIDFAHAKFVPGQGPDDNVLLGVRSLVGLFEKMAK